jgi:hypothetical protein
MKKKILGGIAVLAIAAVAAWNVGLSSQKNDGLSDIMLANVEALASGESVLDYRIYYVYAASSTQWTCYTPGRSACPAP